MSIFVSMNNTDESQEKIEKKDAFLRVGLPVLKLSVKEAFESTEKKEFQSEKELEKKTSDILKIFFEAFCLFHTTRGLRLIKIPVYFISVKFGSGEGLTPEKKKLFDTAQNKNEKGIFSVILYGLSGGRWLGYEIAVGTNKKEEKGKDGGLIGPGQAFGCWRYNPESDMVETIAILPFKKAFSGELNDPKSEQKSEAKPEPSPEAKYKNLKEEVTKTHNYSPAADQGTKKTSSMGKVSIIIICITIAIVVISLYYFFVNKVHQSE